MRKEIRFTGFGGQGIITAGYFLGQAAAVYENVHATMVQSYGPEARGSACASQVIISDKPILNPYLEQQDILVAMSQEGFDQYINKTRSGGLVFIDSDLVNPPKKKLPARLHGIPATRLAEHNLKRRIMANVIMLSFFISVSGMVKPESIQSSIVAWAPEGTQMINEFALKLGRQPLEEVEKLLAP